MRSEINGIESWHGIVPRKPGRNPSAYYGRTSKATSCRASPRVRIHVSDFAQPAKTRHAPVFLPEFRFDAFLREELQVYMVGAWKDYRFLDIFREVDGDWTHLRVMVFFFFFLYCWLFRLFVDLSNWEIRLRFRVFFIFIQQLDYWFLWFLTNQKMKWNNIYTLCISCGFL